MTAAHPLLVLLVVCYGQPDGNKAPPPDDDTEVLRMLRVDDQLGGEQRALVELGERLFPAYHRILAAKDATPIETSRIFVVLAAVKADRKEFLDEAIAALAHRHPSVRRSAVQLLAQIGRSRDTAPVVALLSDEEWTIPFAAAKTLVAIGDQRTVAAMDVWLNSSIHRPNAAEYAEQRKHVAKCRDELKERLGREKKPGK